MGMNLQMLQTNLAALIKSREVVIPREDNYLAAVKDSKNLLLIKKIGLWWRKIQIEPYCVLTSNYLKSDGRFEREIQDFISKKDFSLFREEVGLQFLDYVISRHLDSLSQSLAEFELAILKSKLGEHVKCTISWDYEPYSIISALLHNTLTAADLSGGKYEVLVDSSNKEELFTVKEYVLSHPESA